MAKEKPDDSLEGYTSKVIRGPERSVKAMLLAEHLILSVTAPPLKAILHITQAASMFSEKDTKKLKIDPEEVETLLTLASLLDDPPDLAKEGKNPMLSISIQSLLGEEARYFDPWVKVRAYNAYYNPHKPIDEQIDEFEEKSSIAPLVYSLSNLSESGYNALITDFVTWAMPKAARIAEKISSMVDSGTFGDVMKMITKPIEARI